MKNQSKNRRRFRIYSALTALFSLSLLVGILASHFNIGQNILTGIATKNTADYTITLDSSNKVTSAGDTVQHTKRGSNVTFTYSNIANSTTGHTTLNSGGTLVNKDQITSIDAITANYSGAGTLKARLAFAVGTWSEYFTLASGSRVETGSHPYYLELKADGGAITLDSAKYEFTCVTNADAESQDTSGHYDITFKANGSDGTNAISGQSVLDEIQSGASYVSSASSASRVYPGASGLKLGASSNAGSVTFDLSTAGQVEATTIVVNAKLYNSSKSATLSVNSQTAQSVSSSFSDLEFNINSSITSISLSSSKYIFISSITVNYGGSSEPGQPSNPTDYEVGFTADDLNKNSYTTNSIFTNDSALVVKSIKSDSTETTLNANQYSYTITNAYDQTINPNEKFPAEGIYTLTVSYSNYIPQEIILTVGEYVYVTDVSAAMTKVSFTTADTLSNDLEGKLTANLEFSNNTTGEAIAYSEFGTYGIGIKLLNPKGITYDYTKPFGTAGTWTLKVYNLVDENMYYNISLTVSAIPVTNIAMSEASASLYVGGTLQLTATVTPSNATNADYVWASQDESVATVSESGLVTAVAVGGTTITATALDGSGVYGSCAVTVSAKPASTTETLTITISSFTNATTAYAWYNWSESTTDSTIIAGKGEIYKAANADSMQFNRGKGNKVAAIFNTTAIPGSITKIEATTGSGTNRNWSAYVSSTAYSASGSTLTSGSNSTQIGDSITVDTSTTSLGTSSAGYSYFCLQEETTSASYLSEIKITYSTAGSTPVTPTYPTAISLSAESSSISIGATTQLTVGYTPNDTNVKNVTYSSSNESIATVSNTGLVTGIAQGSATITATAQTESGTTTATTTITVTPIAVTSVSLSSNSETIKVGKTVTLVPTISPSNATNKNVTWTSSNTGIATVSGGTVTGVAAGTATITVTTVSGSKTATCTVVVQEASAGGEETFSITYTDLPSTYQTGSTVYTASSGIKFQAYNCANYSSKMQFKASSGYLQNTEDLELQSITINDRESNTLTVYGSNTAGSFSTEITGTNDVYDLTGYSYFKVARTASGAAYCSSITVVTGTPTPTDPTSILLSPTSAELAPGGTKQLNVTYVPSNANQNKEVTWTSSNTNVATVSSDGLVSVKSTATAGQSATITARLTNLTSIYATCSISVVEQSKDDHTVLIYMCGADLESENQLATGDIQEILKVSGQPDDVNIVIETGGAKSWASTYGISSTYLERYHVENKSLVRDNQLTYASMGLSSTLQSFIEYGLNNYPADRVGLVFWNHGGGMRGVCYDEKKNDDVLKNSEIQSAVSGALSNCGMSGQKLEWVGYDACLMAVQDIAETNSDYFNYMIASEESEAGYGWDYDNWVDDLYSKKTTTTILKAIVDGFISDNGGANSSSGDQTLSYLNLSYASAYKTAWENMASQLNSVVTSSNKSSFNSAITSNVKHYADSDYDYFCTFDAWDFVDKLANNSAFSSFRIDSSYTTAVKNAHANLVAYNLAQKGAGVSKGLCMYWPNSTQYSDVSTYYTTSETRFTTWRSFCVNKGTHA